MGLTQIQLSLITLDLFLTYMDITKIKIGIIGLGYVGLPLALAFSKHFKTTGFDINQQRILELKAGEDKTLEAAADELAQSHLEYTENIDELSQCNVYIVTVPTPIDSYKRPDLSPLINASKMIASVLEQDDVVIYESTVYPGATEDDCVPVLEKESGLSLNQGFYVGYSPERINPGDKVHRLVDIKKVTSGSTPDIATFVDDLYQTIITAGTHKASSIKVAEASKVIENTQRDLNISLINELALIFNRLDIDTQEVLDAAATKWNVLPYTPGLVGGHCIGVDPYYLTHKAQQVGYHPEVILAGRRVNDGMGRYIADMVMRLMSRKRIHIVDSNILVLGIAFKENCPDLRNTRVVDLIKGLQNHNANVDIYDPWVNPEEVKQAYQLDVIEALEQGKYHAIILAVAHEQFLQLGAKGIHALGAEKHVLYDIKSVLPIDEVDARL